MQNLPVRVSAIFAISRWCNIRRKADVQIFHFGILRAKNVILKDADFALLKRAKIARDSN